MLNSKKSSNSKRLSADQAFYYIHVTLYHHVYTAVVFRLKHINKTYANGVSFIEREKAVLKILQILWIDHMIYFFFIFAKSFWLLWVSVGVKGLQSYLLSNFEALKKFCCFGYYSRSVCKHVWFRFESYCILIILKVWWTVTLQPFDLQTLYYQQFKRLAAF